MAEINDRPTLPEDAPTSPETPASRRSGLIELVDVSAFQPEQLDYAKLARGGIAGALVKLTDGVGSPDAHARAHVAGFKTFGMRAGGYHFLRVRGGAQDAAAQAAEFCGAYLRLGCDLVAAVDCEDQVDEHGQPVDRTAAEWLTAIRDFVAKVRDVLVCRPFIYSYPYFWRGLGPEVADAKDLADCPLWWAEYGVMPHPAYPWPSSWPALWQYTDKGLVSGIPGPVDRSRTRLALDELVAATSL